MGMLQQAHRRGCELHEQVLLEKESFKKNAKEHRPGGLMMYREML